MTAAAAKNQHFSVDPFRLYAKVVLCSLKDKCLGQTPEQIIEIAKRTWSSIDDIGKRKWMVYAEKVGEKVSNMVTAGKSQNVQEFLDEVRTRVSTS
jgi:hypothetical protein